jgi:hypothetical protein
VLTDATLGSLVESGTLPTAVCSSVSSPNLQIPYRQFSSGIRDFQYESLAEGIFPWPDETQRLECHEIIAGVKNIVLGV